MDSHVKIFEINGLTKVWSSAHPSSACMSFLLLGTDNVHGQITNIFTNQMEAIVYIALLESIPLMLPLQPVPLNTFLWLPSQHHSSCKSLHTSFS